MSLKLEWALTQTFHCPLPLLDQLSTCFCSSFDLCAIERSFAPVFPQGFDLMVFLAPYDEVSECRFRDTSGNCLFLVALFEVRRWSALPPLGRNMLVLLFFLNITDEALH